MIISPTNLSKASEFHIRFALDAIDSSASSTTDIEKIFHLNSAAGAAEFYAEGAECSSSNCLPSSIDLSKKHREKKSTFSKKVESRPLKIDLEVDFWGYRIPFLSKVLPPIPGKV